MPIPYGILAEFWTGTKVMFTRLSISWLILLISFGPLQAMTYAEMKELRGASLIAERADAVF